MKLLLPFAAFFATMPLYSVNLIPFSQLPDGSSLAACFLSTFFATTAAVGAALAALGKTEISKRLGSSVAALTACALLYSIGYGGLLWHLVSDAEASLLLGGFAVLASLGFAPLCLFWGSLLTRLSINQAPRFFAMVVGGSAVATVLLSGLDLEAGIILFCILLAVGAAAPIVVAKMAADETLAEDFGAPFISAEEAFPAADKGVLELTGLRTSSERDGFLVLALPLAGLMLLAFAITAKNPVTILGTDPMVMGSILASAVVTLTALLRTGEPLFPFLIRACVPATVLVLFCLCTLLTLFSHLIWLTTLMSYTIFGMMGVIALSLICNSSIARQTNQTTILALVMLGYSAVSLLGMHLSSTPSLWGHVSPALFFVSVMHALLSVALPFIMKGSQNSAISEADAFRDLAELRVHAVSEKYALTQRETTILSYIAQGYGAAYIAQELTLAQSTVRTHFNNLYKKLGVTSREEILALVRDEVL